MLKPSTEMDIAVIDKTVPRDDYREHNGLFWVLINEKITRPDGELYDIGGDYFGYDPYDGAPTEDYQVNEHPDLIYIADTYGVYADDLEETVEGDRSEQVYGGMNLLEWNSVMDSKGEDTLLIAEYNSFASPTDESTRKVMANNLNVDWSGWSGRYFDDLNSEEIPAWLIRNYEKQYNKEWTFEGIGLAFVSLSDQVVILDEENLTGAVQFVPNKLGFEKFPEIQESTYAYWFDIITPKNDAVVLANYQLPIHNDAIIQLKQAGIPTTFPAIIHHEQKRTYYFAGDYADYPKTNLRKWQGSPLVMNLFSNDESNFFWVSYLPIMKVILADIAENS